MNQDTIAFIETCTKRISLASGNKLENLFEKYTALYTLYNRLYNESFGQLKSDNRLTKTRYSDFDRATSLVVEFNTSVDIVKSLKDRNNFSDLQTIADLIKQDIFSINLADGIGQRDYDVQLMNNLESNNDDVKAQAALSTIYNVRCNMQHGEKHFEEHQRLLLEPLIRILQTVVDLQVEKLK
ncbi:MAG: hypothetical protein ABI663_18710 [Chryseolinea sp.]